MKARLTVALTGLSWLLLADVGHATPPSALGFRVVWVHQRVTGRLDPSDPLCRGDVAARRDEAERFLAKLDAGLERGRREEAGLQPKDREHPEVAAAIAHMDALEACAGRIRAGLAGEAPPAVLEGGPGGEGEPDSPGAREGDAKGFLSDAEPGTPEALVASVSPADRAVLTRLAAWSPATPEALPESVAELGAMAAAAERIWPRCTGELAAVVMAGPPPDGAPADGDVWAWCRAAAQRVTHGREMVEGMIARSAAALEQARATLEAAGEGATRALEAAAEDAEAAAGRVRDAAAKGAAEAQRLAESVAAQAEAGLAGAARTLEDQLAELDALYGVVGRTPDAAAAAAMGAARELSGKLSGYVERARAAAERVVDALADKANARVKRLAAKGADAARDHARRALEGLLGKKPR